MQSFNKTLALAAMAVGSMYGQAVVSAKAGVVHYIEGDVNLGDGTTWTTVEVKNGGRLTEMKEGQQLATSEGRAEVLLNPGVILRLGENSKIKMVSNKLTSTHVELLDGVALVEVSDGLENSAVSVTVKDVTASLKKMVLARFATASGVRIYKGEAELTAAGTKQTLKDGREFLFGENIVAKFDTKVTDPLYRWANRRAEYIAMANVSTARMVQRSGYAGYGAGWYLNPYYGLFTYLPIGSGMYRTPFGYAYYSPTGVFRCYQNYLAARTPVYAGGGSAGNSAGRTWNQDYGYYQTQGRSAGSVSSGNSGYVGNSSVSAPAAAAPAPEPAGRGADVGTGRGGASSSGH